MRAAIYTRVSQDRNGRGRSVEEQEAVCRDLCEQNMWEIVGHYTDNDRSASRYARKGRPDFERLMSELEQVDVIVTWEASRATRDLNVYTKMRDACRKAGVKWAYNGRVYDFERADDSFTTGLDMLVAERESGETSKRVQRAVRAQADAGKPHGRIPFGYTRVYDPDTGNLLRQVPHPEESKVIIEAATRVLAGETLYQIAKDFKQRGNYRLSDLRIQRLLRSPTYAGKRVYRGEVLRDADWPGLIDPERWEALQGVLGSPDRTKFHGTEPAHLLTGIATCGVCGGPIVRLVNRGKYPTYVCKGSQCVGRAQLPTDALVVAVVKNILMRPDALEAIHAHADPGISDAAKKVRELEMRLESHYDEAANGTLSAAGLARVESSILSQIDTARGRLRAMSTPKKLTIADPAATAARWDNLPVLTRRMIVRGLMEVRIMPARARGVRFEPESVAIIQHRF